MEYAYAVIIALSSFSLILLEKVDAFPSILVQ